MNKIRTKFAVVRFSRSVNHCWAWSDGPDGGSATIGGLVPSLSGPVAVLSTTWEAEGGSF